MALVDLAARTKFDEIALRSGEPLEELGLEVDVEAAFRELQHAPGVAEDLRGLDARELVEEPSAARVHEHRVALKLEELERPDALRGIERAMPDLAEEMIDALLTGVEDDVDVMVARAPGMPEEVAAFVLEPGRDLVAEPVEGVAERAPPLLVPALRRARVAAAVGAPAGNAVRAAPRRVLVDLHFMRRWR